MHPIYQVFVNPITGEIMTDEFCGGGGASTGMELATGVPVAVAVNHDPDAILMHQTNHPHTGHLQASVWDVDPVEACQGYPVGLSWFSPDCKHFSKAKGAALVDRNIRGLAWIVLRWAGTVRPRVIILENVEEFRTWGPVRKGRPVKSKAGQTFDKWLSQLKDLGYTVEWRELVAADYGAPTTRKRFVLIARCDGEPIVWPEPTHGPRDSEAVKAGRLAPWRSAAEIIDWSLPCPSIFDDKQTIKEQYNLTAVRPLARNTLRRVIRGVDKFTIKSGRPFLVPTGYGERPGQAPRVHDPDSPLPTAVGKGKHGVCDPLLSPFHAHNHQNAAGTAVTDPLNTVTSSGSQMLIASSLIQYHAEQSERMRGQGLGDPIMTIDSSNRYALGAAVLTKYYSGDNNQDPFVPLHTVTAHDREGLALAHLAEFKGQDKGQAVAEPLRTITAGGGEFGVVKATVVKAEAGADLQHWPEIRALLNEHCGYDLADDDIILLTIGGVPYFIADIGLRMLTPRELYNAMGFPPDYVIDQDYTGKPYGKSKQVARCGNAVCPPMAEAVVRANFPEWCGGRIITMSELEREIAG